MDQGYGSVAQHLLANKHEVLKVPHSINGTQKTQKPARDPVEEFHHVKSNEVSVTKEKHNRFI